jgi:hypothetical protein
MSRSKKRSALDEAVRRLPLTVKENERGEAAQWIAEVRTQPPERQLAAAFALGMAFARREGKRGRKNVWDTYEGATLLAGVEKKMRNEKLKASEACKLLAGKGAYAGITAATLRRRYYTHGEGARFLLDNGLVD